MGGGWEGEGEGGGGGRGGGAVQQEVGNRLDGVWTTAADLVLELSLPAALPLLEDFGQLVQAGVVEVKDLVLALSAGDHQLATGARLVATVEQGMLTGWLLVINAVYDTYI